MEVVRVVFKKSEPVLRLHGSKLSQGLIPELVEIRLLVLMGNYLLGVESEIGAGKLLEFSVLFKIEDCIVEARGQFKSEFYLCPPPVRNLRFSCVWRFFLRSRSRVQARCLLT